jgi:hypothetical protein
MDSPRNEWTVLARIPDLNAAGADGAADDDPDGGWPTSAGRLIKQALAFRLLIGTALFLLAAAVIPFILGKKAPSVDASSASDLATAWHSPSSSMSANASPMGKLPPAGTAPQRPVALIPATPERSRPPAIIPPVPDANVASQPHRTTDNPLMSRWPNPARAPSPLAGAEGPQASANQPIAVRPSEYEADRRAGRRSENSDNPSKK